MGVHPEWFDAEMDYSAPRYAHARQLGADAARMLQSNWQESEPMLQGIWQPLPGGMTWKEARGAIYEGWLETRKAARARA